MQSSYSPITKHESGLSLRFVVRRRRTADDESRPRVAPQTLLQHSRQLRVSVRNERFLERENESILESEPNERV